MKKPTIAPTRWHRAPAAGICSVCRAPATIADRQHRAADFDLAKNASWIFCAKGGRLDVCHAPAAIAASPAKIISTQWHHKPAGKHDVCCPYCGAPGQARGLHCRLPGSDGQSPKFVFLKRCGASYLEIVAEKHQGRHPQRGYQVDTSHRQTITTAVRQRIIDATHRLAYGLTWREVAAELGISEGKLLDYHERHRKLWDFSLAEAAKGAAAVLKTMAGKPEIFRNNAKLIRVAIAAAEQRGDPPFPSGVVAGGRRRLWEFLEGVYIPSRIEISSEWIKRLRSSVRRYSAFLGKDPLLDELNEADLCRYLTALRRSQGAVTVNHERQLHLTLWSNAYDQGLCERPPRLKLVRRVPEEVDPPEAWTAEECSQLFSVAAEWPGWVDEVPAGRWWLSLLLSVYWTSCRIGALLTTPTAAYTTGGSSNSGGILVRKQKNHRPQWFPLPLSCCAAIDATRPTGREKLWHWPQHPRTMWQRMREIVEAAGLPCPRTGRQLFHRLRRTTLSLCAAVDPAIAQRQAGHADYATTLRHYIDPRLSRGRSAADVLPEPVIHSRTAAALPLERH
jgi:integrase